MRKLTAALFAAMLASTAVPAIAQDAGGATPAAAVEDDDDGFDLGWLGLLGLAGLLGLRRRDDRHAGSATTAHR